MKLLAIPDASGEPMFWINVGHLVSVSRLLLQTGRVVRLVSELKISGLPLHRIELGTFDSVESADKPWAAFPSHLES